MLNYYYSGVAPLKEETVDRMTLNAKFRLLSCHDSYAKYADKWLSISSQYHKKITILLDSGAFTAWNQNKEVTLDPLIKVYYKIMEKYWSDCIEIYLINLDKIPGAPGRTADQKEMDECEKISDHNFEILVKHFGDRVLPVFHQNESMTRLTTVCQMSNYICVSPRNDLGEKYRLKWSKEVHNNIPSHIRTHGLAATGFNMMTQVPWTSVDSAWWLFTAGTGSIVICANGNIPRIVGISSKSPTRHTKDQHYLTLSDHERVVIDQRLAYHGYTADEVAESYELRMLLIILEVNYWLEHYHKFDFIDEGSLFGL